MSYVPIQERPETLQSLLRYLLTSILLLLVGCPSSDSGNNGNNAAIGTITGTISIRDVNTNQIIDENNPAFIDRSGQLPALQATVQYDSGVAPATIAWTFSSSHPRRPLDTTNSNTFLRRYCADADVDNQYFESNGAADSWDIMQGLDRSNPLVSFGAANVSTGSSPPLAKVTATNAAETFFNIFGYNPVGQDVQTYITNHNPAPPHQYAYKMARHESGTPNTESEVRQFNPSSTAAKYRNTPNYGAPDGWGIMQVDHHCSADGTRQKVDPVPTYVVWNWKSNITAGIDVLNWASTTAVTRYREIVRYHQEVTSVQTGETHPTALPATITIDNRTISPMDACKIQLYNGSAGVRYQPARRVSGEDYSTRQFCMIYNPATKTWTFDRNASHNGEGYVTQVLAIQG